MILKTLGINPGISFIAALFFSVILPLPRAGGQMIITQGEWAKELGRGLGLDKEMPPEAESERYIAVLGSKGYRRVEGEDFQESSPGLEVRTSTDYGLPSRKKWMEAEKNGWLKYRFETPVRRPYTLRARVRGDIQFWSVDGKGSVLVIPKNNLEWIEVGEFTLEAGEHEVTVSVPSGGGVDVFELVTGAVTAIEPPGGYQPSEPLTFADKATTMIRALGLENQLPIDEGFYLIIEAERFERAEGKFDISKDPRPGRASEEKWLKADEVVSSFYTFEVPERGMYSIYARGFGGRRETWTIDEGKETVMITPPATDKFAWYPVTTSLLDTGPHSIEAELKGGTGSDVIMIVRRRAGPGNYLQLLSDLGLSEGALPGKKTDEEKRRYQLYRKIEAEDYLKAEGKVEKSAEERYGIPSDREWVKPAAGKAVFRYEVELKEDGMYSLYARDFGPYLIAWKIDPGKEKSREERKIFPWSENEFLWQEVVTLELAKGVHSFEITVPSEDGFDVFELRKRSWSAVELENLAGQEVSRLEARKNLEEIGKGPTEPEEPVPTPGPEREPTPPDEGEWPTPTPFLRPTPTPAVRPTPTPWYPPLSPYIP